MKEKNEIVIIGARVHNLKNVDVRIPRDKLVVITGLSGSGKSSLAFDTIFAEGQRRYMETFSSYARGYIGTMQRPDVDKITGLSPVISIDQKTTSRNPRSTVGTVTEVYDYLRLLFARAADAYSYATNEKMVQYTDDQIIDLIIQNYAGKKVLVLAPMVNNRKGHYKELFETIRRKGYMYVRVDGEVMEIAPGMKLDRYKNHTIEVVVDRLKLTDKARGEEDMKRLRATVDKAMVQGNGVMAICVVNSGLENASSLSLRYFSRHLMCPTTGMSYAEPAPHTFSFNSPQGWCPYCRGLGRVKGDEAKNAISDQGNEQEELDNIIKDDENWYTRMLAYLDEAKKEEAKGEEDVWHTCPACEGKRLNREALSFRIADKNIAELSAMDITDLRAWLMNVPASLNHKQRAIAEPIIKEIVSRLGFMLSVGLSYLSLSRSSDSLSGGENQRIRLATQVGSRLVNVLYILDEPSIGLHQRDNQRLIDSLKQLRDMGNSVIVVEHDEDMMRQADYIVDIGPKAGRLGGHITFVGTPAELLKSDTLTAQYLRGEKSATLPIANSPLPDNASAPNTLVLRGCRGNNLKGVDVAFPLRQMIAVTGVSGSGKSTLINQTLYPILSQHFYRSLQAPLAYDSIEGIEQIDKVIAVDQSPIGRTPRSNPATYTGVFTDIRNLFAQLPESKIRSWKAGRFSFNNAGGRCEECGGNGYKTIQMHFLPDVFVPCEVCGGKRYNRETLEARFKGKTIADVLEMTINQAVEFFESQPYILKKIKTLQDVGLGYIKLGQSSTTLSGGESQRVKLATELARPGTGNTLYILDEPTTGLHFEDVRVLMGVLRQLVDKGNTVIIIEHNPDVVRSCDYLIDMGPDGGRDGGQVVATGTVEDIRNNPNSITGRYI